MSATDTITVIEGYEAMRIFLETLRRRHGEMADELDFILRARLMSAPSQQAT